MSIRSMALVVFCLLAGSCHNLRYFTLDLEHYFSNDDLNVLEESTSWFEVELMEAHPSKRLELSYEAYLRDYSKAKLSPDFFLKLRGLGFLKEMESMGLRQRLWGCSETPLGRYCELNPAGPLMDYIQHHRQAGEMAWTIQRGLTLRIQPGLVAESIAEALADGYRLTQNDRLFVCLYFHFTGALNFKGALGGH